MMMMNLKSLTASLHLIITQVTVIHQIWRRKCGLFRRSWRTQLRSLYCHTRTRDGSCSSRQRVQSAARVAHWPASASRRRSSTNILSSDLVRSHPSSTSTWPVTEQVTCVYFLSLCSLSGFGIQAHTSSVGDAKQLKLKSFPSHKGP